MSEPVLSIPVMISGEQIGTAHIKDEEVVITFVDLEIIQDLRSMFLEREADSLFIAPNYTDKYKQRLVYVGKAKHRKTN